jgi:hypothetical protein
MENYGEISIADFVQLMKDYVGLRIDADQYRQMYFELTKKRVHIPNDTVNQIIQQAYGDADDYDPTVTLPYTLDDDDLRKRVAKSLDALAVLGY